MTRFVVSDNHFNHENIIGYAERPYNSLDRMNTQMIRNWNNTISDDDTVIYGGDLTFGSLDDAEDIISRLNGNMMMIEGNHDDYSAENVSVPMVEDTIIQHMGYRFWYTHRPENVPDDWTEWELHGHVHNNLPFINYSDNRINISVDVIEYTPIPLKIIVKALKQLGNGDICYTIKDSPISDFEWYNENIK